MSGFDVQLRKALPDLWRYGFSLTRDHAQADDLVQDCVERTLRKKLMWQADAPLKPWMMKILLNLFRDRYRSQGRRAEVPFENEHGGAVSDAAWQDLDELRVVMNRMRDLPETQRQALQLVAFGGLTYSEAADVLEVPIGTVLSRVSRARAHLNTEATPVAHGIRSVK
ncbi:sigma-70 family RNA polymerase sigma factor [Epibacterium sp. SM1969]|uniref:Sigma-70 family RNA polymerase sigma factor n=1 Tax=Tritonibacter aquimaris TaxID=2663379 RepID=A0A844AMX7_9RHOB|nr:RNA polymerase sigma factor [Tritonibacter aquimaris]MQY43469.1 sigma-70 family RNA polymerase sigma factor [Tritonibacter aquimaris]